MTENGGLPTDREERKQPLLAFYLFSFKNFKGRSGGFEARRERSERRGG
jgi:hypothetical protein